MIDNFLRAVTRSYRPLLLAAAATVLLSACGDSDEESEDAAGTSGATRTSGSNEPRGLTISGSPLREVMIDYDYYFRPSASDPEGDPLTFSIANKPAWATFDKATGRLTGNPQLADVGEYRDITISVTDGSTTKELGPFRINVVEFGLGSATLSWDAPVENIDGSQLTDLAGFKVYWGTEPRQYQKSVTLEGTGLLDFAVDNLTNATWYFSVTAYNQAGIEGVLSNEVTKQIVY